MKFDLLVFCIKVPAGQQGLLLPQFTGAECGRLPMRVLLALAAGLLLARVAASDRFKHAFDN